MNCQISDRMHVRQARLHFECSIQECSECSLHRYGPNIQSKSMGNGNCYDPEIFFIGTAPSYHRWALRQNRFGESIPLRTFEYRVGAKFRRLLKRIGLYERSYLTNLLKCSTPKNRKPKSREIENCSVWLRNEFNRHFPKVIVPLGGVARAAIEKITKPLDDDRRFLFGVDVVVINCFHPSYCFNYGGIPEEEYAKLLSRIGQALK